MLHYVTLENY